MLQQKITYRGATEITTRSRFASVLKLTGKRCFAIAHKRRCEGSFALLELKGERLPSAKLIQSNTLNWLNRALTKVRVVLDNSTCIGRIKLQDRHWFSSRTKKTGATTITMLRSLLKFSTCHWEHFHKIASALNIYSKSFLSLWILWSFRH